MEFTVDPAEVGAAVFAAMNVALFFATIFVLLMQPGFMLLEVGLISRRNAVNDIYKNFLDICVGAVAFWLVGWDILTGESHLTDALVGLGLANAADAAQPPPRITPSDSIAFVFQLGFATTAATICSGAVTGRIRPHAYLVFAALFTGLFYPMLAFSVWHPQGLLYGRFYDFAGSMIVHGAGAAAGLAGTILLRPRIGFNGFDPLKLGREQLFRIARRHAPHNIPVAALGVFLLWLGWFGFNGGAFLVAGASPTALTTPGGLAEFFDSFGDIMTATVIAPAASATATSVLHVILREERNLADTMYALVAGAVAVTAGVDLYTPAEAALVGVGAAMVYRLTRFVLERRDIDDPIAAIAMHGFPGLFGVTVAGIAHAAAVEADIVTAGLWHASMGVTLFFAIFTASIGAFWALGVGARLLTPSSKRKGAEGPRPKSGLRLNYETEIEGIDVELHGLDAYNFGYRDEDASSPSPEPNSNRNAPS